jgi:hypothetical protein
MKGLWRADAVAIAALVAVNVVARLIVRVADPGANAEFIVGLASLGAMGVLAAVFAFVWTKRYPSPKVVSDSLIVVSITGVLVTLVGPFVFGKTLGDYAGFGEWFAVFLLQLFICLAVLAAGVVIGALIAIALGIDPTSRAWKAQAARVPAAARKAKKPKPRQAGARR